MDSDRPASVDWFCRSAPKHIASFRAAVPDIAILQCMCHARRFRRCCAWQLLASQDVTACGIFLPCRQARGCPPQNHAAVAALVRNRRLGCQALPKCPDDAGGGEERRCRAECRMGMEQLILWDAIPLTCRCRGPAHRSLDETAPDHCLQRPSDPTGLAASSAECRSEEARGQGLGESSGGQRVQSHCLTGAATANPDVRRERSEG